MNSCLCHYICYFFMRFLVCSQTHLHLISFIRFGSSVLESQSVEVWKRRRFEGRTLAVFNGSFLLIWILLWRTLPVRPARSCPLKKGRVKWPTSRPQRPLLFFILHILGTNICFELTFFLLPILFVVVLNWKTSSKSSIFLSFQNLVRCW